MNPKKISVYSLVLILLTACQPAEPNEVTQPPTATVPTPEIIINQAIDAWNAGDVATLKALYADDATVCFPDWGDECTVGAEEISAWIVELVEMDFTLDPESLETEGDIVTIMAQVWSDPTREMGIAPLETTDVYTVLDGKIKSQTSTLTEESSIALSSAIAAEQTSAVVLSFVESINAGDVEAAMDLMRQDVYVEMTPTLLPGFPIISGMQKVVRTWLEEMVAVNLIVEAEILSVKGNSVTVQSKIWSDYLDSLHAAPISVDENYEVYEGQIVSWNRVIPPESLNKIQEGLIEFGIPDTITPEPGEVLASKSGDIVGSWKTTIQGAGDVHINLNGNGKYEMEGDSGSFWFNEPFLWMRTDKIHFPGDIHHSCQDTTSIGSYVVYATRSGEQSVELRFIPILDTCLLRSTFLGQQNLSLDN